MGNSCIVCRSRTPGDRGADQKYSSVGESRKRACDLGKKGPSNSGRLRNQKNGPSNSGISNEHTKRVWKKNLSVNDQ